QPYLDQYQAHRAFGTWVGEQCARLIKRHETRPDYIASHGHTIEHLPEKGISLQIGDPEQIAQLTHCPVIYNFRNADIQAGGQGAPLAPVVERHCFPGHDFYLNLGGIANISVHTSDTIHAYDIAPCNQLLNYLARQEGMDFDRDGLIASAGQVQEDLLRALQAPVPLPLKNAFSLDNNWIRATYLPILDTRHSVANKMRTVVEFIARSVAIQVNDQPGDSEQTMLITGGGTHNLFLIARIQANLLPQTRIIIPERTIIDYKEAILIALCGALRLHNLPNAFASATGALHDTVNGDFWDPVIMA
ncbi:MAG: anhydro-N-acetylmuramic acid kinase, partial [Saprospiraceae bacterium]|nr:anhydro-N-acetylmuramic acid kinase [Saprospiraceae bacterium]